MQLSRKVKGLIINISKNLNYHYINIKKLHNNEIYKITFIQQFMYIFEKLFLLAFTNQKNAVGEEYFFSTPYIILITVLDLFIKEYLDINTTNPKQMDIKVLKQSSDNLSHIEKLIFEYVASDSKFNKVDETVKIFTKTRISEQILEKLIQQNILIK